MGYLMRKEQAFDRHLEAQARLAAEAGHDHAAFERAVYLRQLEDRREWVGESFGDEFLAMVDEKIAEVRAEGPIGCSCSWCQQAHLR